jgi:phosphopantothenoylcysteine synthetase/decarboxylase
MRWNVKYLTLNRNRLLLFECARWSKMSQREKMHYPVTDLRGKPVVVTAGGTREPIDPIRFIGNRPSGKMGFALADAARERGARVTLITTVPPRIQAAWWDCTMRVTNEPRSVAKETGI